MTVYLDLLSDDLYQLVYRNIMDECIQQVADHCSLNRRHQGLAEAPAAVRGQLQQQPAPHAADDAQPGGAGRHGRC
eukprot:COSAG02_NODE_6734_length_3394_cov_2.435508_3_plen_76_part_00